MITLEDVGRSYRLWAPVYDLVFGAVLADGRKKVAEVVRQFAPGSLLEMGAGTGLLLPLYPRQTQVTAVDISDEMLAHARRRCHARRLSNVSIETADCERLGYPDGAFDCVVLPYILSVTPRPGALVQEAIRVCRPGGRIIVLNHFSGARVWAMLEAMAAPVAARIGFRSSFSYDEHILPHPWRVLQVSDANLFSLSKVIVLTPTGTGGVSN